MNARRRWLDPRTKRAPICEKLGVAIREMRWALAVSQEMLAELSGVSLRMIRYIERCKRVPSVESVEWVARALGLSFAELSFIAERIEAGAEA